jgi:Fe2+ or Zn2+ uptake regulation protein
MIYKSVCKVDTHPTAADVFNMVHPHIKNISMGTIYRNLSQLAENNMIIELNINGITHYDGNTTSHQHFVCKECGSIIDCHTQNNWNIDLIQGINEYDIQDIDIIFSGLCQKCKFN